MLPFQPARALSEVLSSADFLITLLEPEAGRFSVPSKVLSYLAVGRPIVGLVPTQNAAAAAILSAGGFVAEPTEEGVSMAAAWIEAIQGEPTMLAKLSGQSRAIAEANFDIARISKTFEDVLASVIADSGQR